MKERSQDQVRHFEFDVVAARARDDGAIPVVITTESVVEVEDGPEVLVHSADAIDLSRAPLPIIDGHGGGDRGNVGIVDGLHVKDGALRGLAKFGSRPEATAYRADVEGGIIRSVSARYRRIKAKVRADGVLFTTRWMPTHVAMVAEPADIGAGFYRSRPEAFDLSYETSSSTPAADAATSGAVHMDETTVTAGAEQTRTQQQTAAPRVEVVEDHGNRATPVDLEKRRKQAIQNLCRANKLDERYAQHWISTGASLETLSDELVKVLSERSADSAATFIDMPKAEVRRYSLMKALRAAQNKDWSKAGLELEANREISKRLSRLPRSETAFFVPLDIMMRDRKVAQRDMTVSGVSGSQYLVGTDNMPGSFIELMRNTSVALNMGVRRMSGLVGNVTIPKMTAGNTAYWLADETTQITESQPTIGQLSLAPKNVAALTELSHQLMQQSTPDAEQMVLDSIARDIALAVDVGVLRGAGSSGQPQGIVGTSGVGSVTGTSLAAAGVLEFQADVASANALNAGCGYVTTPTVAGLLMVRPELPSTGDSRLWKGNMLRGSLFDFPAMTSNQMAAGTMLFGWWDSVILAEWGVLELMTNPYSDFTRGLTAVRGWYTCDVGMRYPAAFSYSSSIT
jgi:HK97 family phage major capsid protein